MMKIIQWNVADKEGGINEVIKGEKKAFLFKGVKRFSLGIKMAILLTKLMNVGYKNFLGAILKKKTNRNKLCHKVPKNRHSLL